MKKRKVIRICLEEEQNIEKIREVSLILQEQNAALIKENEELKKNYKSATSQTQRHQAQK